jgi:dienelactone hydrolase
MRLFVLRWLLVFGLVLLGTAAIWGPAYARGASFVIRAAQLRGRLLEAARAHAQAFTISSVHDVPTRHGAIRGRLYHPNEFTRRSVVLVPGVHAAGIDEPRLTAFASELAATGIEVAAIELPDLTRYEFDARSVDMIEDAALWLKSRASSKRDQKVGLMGISFAGGLSVVAAGRPAIRDDLAFVFSFGGHGDLPRALRYLCTGLEPPTPADPPGAPPRYRAPHDYGVAVILLSLADQMVPSAQVEPLRTGILTFLQASQLDPVDKQAAAELFEQAAHTAASIDEPAATLLRLVNDRNVKDLGARLLPVLEQTPYSASLSPERSAPPVAPVFLLHGTDDTVIPSVETVLLADHLRDKTAVRYLLSRLITHAEADRNPGPGDVMKLVGFWADLLDQ